MDLAQVALLVAIVALLVSIAAWRAARRPRDPMEMLNYRPPTPAPAQMPVPVEPDPYRSPGEPGSVVLVDCGEKKIHVIKIIRTATNIGLKQAKDLVDAPTPVVIAQGLTSEQARALVAELEAVGATAELS